MYTSDSSFVPVQIRKMSSINRFHILICLFVFFFFIIPMNRFAYAGAIFVPIAVPCFCRKYSPFNSNALFFKTMFASSVRICGVGCSRCLYDCVLSFRKSVRLSIPSSCGMFLYSEDTSIDASMQFGGNFYRFDKGS